MWTKEYPGAIGANQSLYYVPGDPAVAGSPVTYFLTGGIDVINS